MFRFRFPKEGCAAFFRTVLNTGFDSIIRTL